jgi:hypothetical protein
MRRIGADAVLGLLLAPVEDQSANYLARGDKETEWISDAMMTRFV